MESQTDSDTSDGMIRGFALDYICDKSTGLERFVARLCLQRERSVSR